MFEDSTFESTGRIRTRSRGWMIAATLVNSAILFALILIPLIYPEALPPQAFPFLMVVPAPPPAPPPPPTQQQPRPARGAAPPQDNPFTAPQRIPHFITIVDRPDPVTTASGPIWDPGPGIPGGVGSPLPGPSATPNVRLVPNHPVRVSGLVVEGLLLYKVVPRYPPIAIATHSAGTVVLSATISKAGTIENLRVISGPPILQQSALDAVKSWRYKPYLLDGQPVEVETTVNVIFTLGG
jgi:protein TonB